MKKQIKFIFLALSLLLLFSGKHAQAQSVFEVDTSSGLAEAIVLSPAGAQSEIIIGTGILAVEDDMPSINNKTIVFTSSDSMGSTRIDGNNIFSGFSATNNSSLTFNNIYFQGGFADGGNGAFLNLRRSSATFNDPVSFTGGVAEYGGALYAYDYSYVNFKDDVIFQNNNTDLDGGGFYSMRSVFDFDAYAEFTNNKADIGGAFYADTGSVITFSSASAFSANQTVSNGAAFYAYRSTVTFNGDAKFENNKSSGSGGAVYAVTSKIDFYEDVSFNYNTSRYKGGAIDASVNSALTFYGDAVFDSNTANDAGTIHAKNSNVVFNSTAVFSNNTAMTGGGALYADDASTVNFNEASYFVNNKTTGSQYHEGNGGAVYNRESLVTFSSPAYFNGNATSHYGGAIYVEAGNLTLSDVTFDGNRADVSGGAVYLMGYSPSDIALLTVNTSSVSAFENNKAAGESNAVHLGIYSQANFNTASGAHVEMRDSITGDAYESLLKISGDGNFDFYGSFSGADMDISASGPGSFNLMSGGKINARKLTINSGSFNMANSSPDTVYVSEFNNYGTLSLDVFNNKGNDKIISSGNVYIDPTASVLNVNTDFADTNFRKKTYEIINFTGNFSGEFSTVTFSGAVSFSSSPVLSYGKLLSNFVTLTILGDNLNTNFYALEGLTFNQRQTAKTFDYLSAESTGDLDTVISLIEGMDENDQKNALAQSSGYFLANVIRSVSVDAENNEIYDRIKNHCLHNKTSDGIWLQFRGAATTFSKNSNSLNDYDDTSGGIMAGFDRYLADNDIMFGVYAKYNSHDIKQDPKNTAEISNTGLGIYGGYIKKDWEIKALITGTYDDYSTKRYIPFIDKKAKADFSGSTVGADIEGAMKFEILEHTNFRPYIGLEAKNSHYNSFDEKGADSLDIEVLGDSYVRSATRVGAGAVYDDKIFSGYINAEAKYLLSGQEPEIEGSFENTDLLFRSKGAEEGRVIFGAGIGGSVMVYENIKLFVNGTYYAADNFQNLYGNIGVRYTFCKNGKSKPAKKEESELTDLERALLAPAPPQPDEAPEVVFEDIPMPVAPDEVQPEPEPEPVKEAEITMDNEDEIAEQALAAAKRREKPVLKSFSLNMANFSTGKSTLTEKAKENIKLQAEEIKKFTYEKITIEGHTDSTGSSAVNKRLSRERAKAVYDEFIEAGIPASKMSYIGFSSMMPAESNKTIDGRAKNRRVEIFVE